MSIRVATARDNPLRVYLSFKTGDTLSSQREMLGLSSLVTSRAAGGKLAKRNVALGRGSKSLRFRMRKRLPYYRTVSGPRSLSTI